MDSDHGPRTTDHGAKWHFWIDRGGTFTDIVARRPDGRLLSSKLLSENPELYEDASLEGIRRILTQEAGRFDPQAVASVRMGSTVATNALLEGTGEPTLLVITRGFGDALRIGYQERPDIFAREIVRPNLPYERVLEADERVGADGETIAPVDEESLEAGLAEAYETGLRSAAIVFMHGYRYPEHEKRAADLAREVGFEHVSVSHEIAPLIKIISRGDTTVVDAHLTPRVREYVGAIREALGSGRLLFMQSSGGLSPADRFRGKDAVLSGPAGGVIGMAAVGMEAGFDRLIGFDMGGTSTDVSLYDTQFERADTFMIGGVRMRTSALDITTVAAGGGSVLEFDGMRLRVGDRSAGAVPGPVCYGRDGPLAVTDCHVQLGRLRPEFFPRVFGPNADQGLDTGAVQAAFDGMANRIETETGVCKSPDELASDFLRIAVQKMSQTIRRISIERGHDPVDFVLIPFGGAAGQHACMVADELGIRKILVHPLAGVLSAYGIGSAAVSHLVKRSSGERLTDESVKAVDELFRDLENEIRHRFDDSDARDSTPDYSRRLHLRYQGTDTPFGVEFAGRAQMESQLADLFRRRFGFPAGDEAVVIDSVELEGRLEVEHPSSSHLTMDQGEDRSEPALRGEVYFGGKLVQAPFHERAHLHPGHEIDGPSVIVEENASTIVEPGWRAIVRDDGNLLLHRIAEAKARNSSGTEYDPTRLEVFNNLFKHIAEEMGIQLGLTARSVNIKERLDYSCAVFDSNGDLVANAPHIPVHIGSMSETVRHLLESFKGRIRQGDAYLTNDPYHGGTHLPDLTVISPYFDGSSQEPLFFVASRAHHAEIGGASPGSMPALSEHIEEEGVLFELFSLIEDGRFDETAVRSALTSGAHPSRNPDTNVADLKAQAAANQRGLDRLREVVESHGLETVRSYMGYVKKNAAEAVRRVLENVENGSFELEMDTGQRIAVSVTVDRDARSAVVDFEGTSAQEKNNLNAPRAVTTAAVLYVFRMLIDDDIPLNAGCLDPIEIRVPEGSMLNPVYPAAVAGGNVETSQCIVDALLGALGVMAGSQGTMNNLTFGDGTHQYYETICGGSGAGPGFNGTSAVHTHMTNSRLTDPEVLESRFPVLLEAFSIREDSGGSGKWRGGNGAIRRIRFMKDMFVSILSNRRSTAPFGLEGGKPGSPGINRLEREDGSVQELEGRAVFDADAGDALVIETPGGGGFGREDPSKRKTPLV